MTFNSIQEVVSRYVGAVKMFDDVHSASNAINELMKPISDGLGISFGAHTSSNNNEYNVITRDIFKKALQKSAWKSVFHKFNMREIILTDLFNKVFYCLRFESGGHILIVAEILEKCKSLRNRKE